MQDQSGLLSISLSVLALTADAAPPSAPEPAALDNIVVVASRAAEPLSQVVASVAQVDRDELDRHLVRDLKGLTRYIPGVGVVADANRFGNRGFSIRGLDGNRVRVLVDGIALADAFSIGQFASAGRDLVDLEAIERVEIQRGPASTLYGSDALAGVVAFRTRDPDDLLRSEGQRYLGLRTAFDGADDSHLVAGGWAGENDGGWQALVLAGRRDGHGADNRAWREEDGPNPQRYRRESVLAKLVHDGDAGRYRLTVDLGREERRTEVDSLQFGAGRFATTYRLDADDRQGRDRVSLAGEWQPSLRWLQALEAQVYVQDTDVRQDSEQYRLADAATPFESLRWRRFEYDSHAVGVSVLGQSRNDGRWGRHWQVFGIDVTRQRYRSLRDGLETNLATGATSATVLGENLPVRDFPHTDADTVAVYWQDEIELNERWALIPGARAEVYRLRAHPDAIFREDFPEARPADIDEQQLTPRLALRFDVGQGHSLFAQYARGFRAPPFGDVNIGLALPVFNYEVRANPDLRPERSYGLELGWRHVGENIRASVSVYENRYRDLIESRANLGVDPESGALVFQSVNRDRARIRGIEGDLLWRMGTLSERLEGWSLRGAAAWSDGEDTRRAQPLNGIHPARATLGLRFEPQFDSWGAELALAAVEPKRRIDHSSGQLFAPPGYARMDFYVWAEPWPGVRINAGVLNLADRRYWDWGSVRGVEAGDAGIGFYTRPGRNAMISIALDW